MTRALVIGLLVLGLVPGGAAGEPTGSGAALLKLVNGNPLTVRGEAFKGGELVRLRVVAEGAKTRRIVTNGGGGFVARFPSISYDGCLGLTINAVGNRGSRAKLRTPRALCPPRL